STDWLDKNQETATAICLSVITASREMMKSFDSYKAAATQLMSKVPDDNELHRVFDIARKYELWPINGDLEKAGYDATVKVALAQKVFDKAPDYEKAIDHRAVDAAMKQLKTIDRATLVK